MLNWSKMDWTNRSRILFKMGVCGGVAGRGASEEKEGGGEGALIEVLAKEMISLKASNMSSLFYFSFHLKRI